MSRLGEIQQSLIGAGKTDEADAVSDLVAEEIGDVLSLQDGRHPFAGVPDN